MKGLILGKRGKRIIALCLVILQVLFQFPVKWKAKANEADKNERITIQFQNQDLKSIPRGEGSLQLEMLVFFHGNNEEGDVERNTEEIDSEEKASSNLISDINNSGEKASDSSPGNDGKVSDSRMFQEGTTKEIRPLSEKEVNKIIEKAASKNLDPSDRLILAWSYEGKTDGSGEVIHAISPTCFKEGYTILLNLRGVYKGISDERLIEYNDGKREVDRDDTGEANKILLTFKEKPVWPGKLEIDKIPEQVFRNEIALSYSVNAKYNNGETPPREIEYYLEDSKKQRKRIDDKQEFIISNPGLYKVFAIIPGDDNHSDLIAERDLTARKAYAGRYFLKNDESIQFDLGQPAVFNVNPEVKGKVTYSYSSEEDKNKGLVEISPDGKNIIMKSIGEVKISATVEAWNQGGIPYAGFPDEITLNITPGHQSGFRFAPSEFIKRVTGDNDVSTYEYEIPYGLTKINGSRDHSFSLKTIGQKSTGKVVYELEDGGRLRT